MAKNIDLIKLFSVEGMVTKKTLVTETVADVARKSPNQAGDDIKALLDQLTVCAVSSDIEGVIDCMTAIQRRVDYMKKTAEQIKKEMGK